MEAEIKIRPTTIVLATLLALLVLAFPMLNRFAKRWSIAHSEVFTPHQFLKFVQDNDIAAVKELLDAGMKPNFRFGETAPLRIAVQRLNPAMVRLLVNGGADLNEKDTQGRTAVMDLTQTMVRHHHIEGQYKTPRQEMLRFIVPLGADVNSPDLSGRTPLDFARIHGEQETTALLLGLGAKGNETLANISNWYEKIKQENFDPDGPSTQAVLQLGSSAALDMFLAFSKRTAGQDHTKREAYLAAAIPKLNISHQRELIPVLVEFLENYSLASLVHKPLLDFGADSVPALLERFGAQSRGHSYSEAGKLLKELGMQSVPFLINALREADNYKVMVVTILLGEFGSVAVDALPELRMLSATATADNVRRAAEVAIRKIDPPILPVIWDGKETLPGPEDPFVQPDSHDE